MATCKPLPSPEEILERVTYDERTGVFYHAKGGKKGKPAGGRDKTGITLYFGKLGRFKAHRIAWRLKTGEDPGELVIDHKDQDPSHNAWENLRKATESQNGYNGSGWTNESTGVKGISMDRGKFRVRLRVGGKRIHVGRFSTLEEAIVAMDIAREKYHGEFANSV